MKTCKQAICRWETFGKCLSWGTYREGIRKATSGISRVLWDDTSDQWRNYKLLLKSALFSKHCWRTFCHDGMNVCLSPIALFKVCKWHMTSMFEFYNYTFSTRILYYRHITIMLRWKQKNLTSFFFPNI